MNYRCTRTKEFTANTPICDRQGHYLSAATIEEALEKMQKRFPGEEFTIETWQ